MSPKRGGVVVWIQPEFEIVGFDDKQNYDPFGEYPVKLATKTFSIRSCKYKARFYGLVYRLKEPLAVITVDGNLKKVPINQIAAFKWTRAGNRSLQ